MSAGVIPFLVIQVAYLISARWLVRISPTIENPDLAARSFWQHKDSGHEKNLKKSEKFPGCTGI